MIWGMFFVCIPYENPELWDFAERNEKFYDFINSRPISSLDTINNYTQWGSTGTGDGEFNYPTRIAINSTGYVYVTDLSNENIQVFSPNGTFVFEFGPVYSVYAIAINATDHVWVGRWASSNQIQIFEPNGTLIRKFGTYGSGDN